ncbi:uncharacterized protein LOC132314990 isoform X2 [Cornus florida]|uniref:uncharacterized protein LOC132314990 isoform X2 n=1 Tax=Cornus florida TaxID=4283 RepID=UPI0028A04269|nr:uncharacterized protein LOC132314990 isoform X2 [Cornus florida]XP_059669783.1 uncharacterized protein LOC132314990 isoform X2 [Cornus florida]
MEKKQLNLNIPLLSVRRLLSVASQDGDNRTTIENSKQKRWNSLPLYKPDIELGEVTKPAAVPFTWEQIPGRPKDGTSAQSQSPEEPSNSSRPPRRVLEVIKQFSKEVSEDQNVIRPHIKSPSLDDNATSLESSNKGLNANGDSDSQSEDDAYSDARDTLSPTESNSFHCSLSNLSGYDGPEVRPSGTFSTDPQTRDFMMSRFLPAARAMVVKTPQCVPRKQPLATDQSRQVQNVVTEETWSLLEQYRSIIIPCDGQYEETDDEDDDSGNISAKACGLFPRFCLKNSLCLFNPVPGIKVRTRTAMPSSTEASRLTRTAYSGPQSQIFDKHAWNAGHKTHVSAVQSHELLEVENKLIDKSNQLTDSGGLHMTDVSSPYKSSKDRGISPYRNVAPQSLFCEGTGFLGVPKVVDNAEPKNSKLCGKGSNNFRDVSSHQRYKQGSHSVSPLTEKTLYIDSVNTVKFISSEEKGPMASSGDAIETLVDHKRMEGISEAESSVQDMRCLINLEGGITPSTKASGFNNGDLSPSFHTSDLKQAKGTERLRPDQILNQEPLSLEKLGSSKVHTNGNLDMTSEQKLKNGLENSNVGSLQSLLPPPLPKSPAESWLWRALPSISSQNSFSNLQSGSQFHPKRQCSNTFSNDTKWETIVKTYNLHCDHELIPYVSQHIKT